MFYGFYRGRGGVRCRVGGMGFGFRGNSPSWPYIGRGRGGRPRCGYYFGSAGAPIPQSYGPRPFYSRMPPAPGYAPNSPQMTREDELNNMKDQAEAIKGQLEEIESRMRDLEAEK
jgi:hypothetical protein